MQSDAAVEVTEPLAERTVTTADSTGASSRLVAYRVRNLPSMVTVPPSGESQRRRTVSGRIWASRQGAACSLPVAGWTNVIRGVGRRLSPVLGRYKGEVALVAEPVARAMVGLRLRPNQLSCLGLGCSVVAAVAFAADQRRTGALCLALAGALDILDGALARVSGQVSPFGAFLDSTLDRIEEGVVLTAVAWHFADRGDALPAAACVFVVLGSLMVSYTRARAEALGVECKVGLATRPVRVVILAAGLPHAPVFLYHSRHDPEVPFDHLGLFAAKLPHATQRPLEGSEHSFINGLPQLVTDIRGLAEESAAGS